MSDRGYCGVGLFNPKSDCNVGSALRACGCYGASFLAFTGGRVSARAATDTQKRYRHMPVFRVDDLQAIIPFDCVPVAVDLIDDAQLLHEYEHPERAFYIFGPEDSTLGHQITDWCRDAVYIPTDYCMNLAATVNVVLYDRQAKRLKEGGGEGE